MTTGFIGLFLETCNFRQAKAIATRRYTYWHDENATEFLGGGYEEYRKETTPKTFHRRPVVDTEKIPCPPHASSSKPPKRG